MPVKTINLEASVEWTKSKLRDLLTDTTDLFRRLDLVVQVSRLSPPEGLSAGQDVYCTLRDRAGHDGMVVDIANAFLSDLCAWHGTVYLNESLDRKNWHCPNISDSSVARWESRGGKYRVELWHGPYDYHYVSDSGCGSVCNPSFPLVAAVTVMQSKLDRGMFLPDRAKLPMERVS